MEPMNGPSGSGEDPASDVTSPPVAHESAALVQPSSETLVPPAGVPVEPELRERGVGLLSFAGRLQEAIRSDRPGWMSRHSSRPRWKREANEPYVDLSPLDLTRRH